MNCWSSCPSVRKKQPNTFVKLNRRYNSLSTLLLHNNNRLALSKPRKFFCLISLCCFDSEGCLMVYSSGHKTGARPFPLRNAARANSSKRGWTSSASTVSGNHSGYQRCYLLISIVITYLWGIRGLIALNQQPDCCTSALLNFTGFLESHQRYSAGAWWAPRVKALSLQKTNTKQLVTSCMLCSSLQKVAGNS